MRKTILTLFICLFAISTSAQDIVNSFIEKYGKDDNLSVVSIGKKMLDTMASMSSDNPEFADAIKGLESIRIVSSKELDLGSEYYNTAYGILSASKGFEEVLSSKEGDGKMIIMTKGSGEIVKELILLAISDSKGFNMIDLSGSINIKTLAKYAGSLNLKGLEKLNSIGKSK